MSFDYVHYKTSCPVCAGKVKGFQSKSGKCDLEHLSVQEVDEWHSICEACNCYIQYTRERDEDNRRIILRRVFHKGKEQEEYRSTQYEIKKRNVYIRVSEEELTEFVNNFLQDYLWRETTARSIARRLMNHFEIISKKEG